MADQSINGIIGRCIIQFAQVGPNNVVSSDNAPFFDETKMAHEMSVIESTINGYKTASHVFQVTSTSYVNTDLIPKMAGSNPFVQVRVGLNLGGTTKWLPFERHIILNDTISVMPDSVSGPKVSFRTVDALWALGYNHVRVHKGTISDMVTKLWNDNIGGNVLVEPCVTPNRGSSIDATGVYYQSNCTDLDFIIGKLTPRAISTSLKSGYRFYMLDDTMHFHTSGYGQNVPKIVQYTGAGPLVNNMMIEDRSIEYDQMGSNGVVVYSYDPVNGLPLNIQSASNGVAIFGNSRGSYSGTPTTIYGHIGPNLAVDENSKAQSIYAAWRTESYTGSITLQSNIDVRLGDIIDVRISSGSAYGGLWEVIKHVMTIDNGVLTTAIKFCRGEINVKAGTQVNDPLASAVTTGKLVPNIQPYKGSGNNTPDASQTLQQGKTVLVQQA